jgi:hypothetical protein
VAGGEGQAHRAGGFLTRAAILMRRSRGVPNSAFARSRDFGMLETRTAAGYRRSWRAGFGWIKRRMGVSNQILRQIKAIGHARQPKFPTLVNKTG